MKNFKEEHRQFVKENSLPNKVGNKTEIRYYAKVEKIVVKPSSQISRLNKHHIWHEDHVQKYLKVNGFVWILRVFLIQTPYMAEINRGTKYSNLKKTSKFIN
ncbi:MAG: DUF1802 family protein [Methanobacterium sp.]|nr:DUF1802 family protein [Methanobacterium sp.]